MYGITQDTKETAGIQYIPAGINENVKWAGVKFEPLKEGGDSILQYEFEDQSGRILSHAVFPVDPETEKKRAQDFPREHKFDNKVLGFERGKKVTPDEAVVKAADDFNRFNKHILNRFCSEEDIIEAQKNVSSYKEFADSVKFLFDNKANKDQLVRVKVVYRSGRWSSLPPFPPFMEEMEVENTSLEITNRDVVTKEAPAQQDPTEFNPDSFGGDGTDLPDEAGF